MEFNWANSNSSNLSKKIIKPLSTGFYERPVYKELQVRRRQSAYRELKFYLYLRPQWQYDREGSDTPEVWVNVRSDGDTAGV